MTLSPDDLQRLLRPVSNRVANTGTRAIVLLVDDDARLQVLQLGASDELSLLGEDTIDDAEHHQPYGLSSVPLPGAESIVLFPNGDRTLPLVIATSDRRHRPTGGEPGEVTLYNHTTPRLILKADGSIEIRSASGTATKLPTLADYEALRAAFNAHTHAVATTGTAAAQTGTAAATTSPVGAPSGTQVLKAE